MVNENEIIEAITNEKTITIKSNNLKLAQEMGQTLIDAFIIDPPFNYWIVGANCVRPRAGEHSLPLRKRPLFNWCLNIKDEDIVYNTLSEEAKQYYKTKEHLPFIMCTITDLFNPAHKHKLVYQFFF